MKTRELFLFTHECWVNKLKVSNVFETPATFEMSTVAMDKRIKHNTN